MPGSSDASGAAPEQPLGIRISDLASNVILCVLTGDFDSATSPQFQQKVAELLEVAPSHLVLDLSDLEFLGSAGLSVLTELDAAQRAVGHHLAVVVDENRAVTRPLRITALDQMLDLHAEPATAVEACRTCSAAATGRVEKS